MHISYSELCLIGGEVGANVDSLIGQGAEHIELMLDGRGWDQFPRRMEELAQALRARRAAYSVHVPVWDVNLASESPHIRAAALESYEASIVFASMIGARYVVIHPGYRSDGRFSAALARERAADAMRELIAFNGAYGRLLLVENIGGPSASIFSQDEYAHFLDGVSGTVGYIVDVGHAFLNGWSIVPLLGSIRERLFALHLHDNDGGNDSHLPLGQGSIDWEGICAGLKSLGRDLELVLEYDIGTELAALPRGKAFLESALGLEEGAR